MAYVFPSEGSLDYFPCHYGSSRVTFRGPKQETRGPYVAMLGGTETYGKFVPSPYAALVAKALGMPVVNLGCVNAGLDVYMNEAELLQLARRADAKVVQVVGAQNLTNRYYAVHPRRNDRFLGATPLLRGLFPKVDFTEFNFTRHMLVALQRDSIDRFEVVAEELRAAWVLRMKALLSQLGGNVVLLWMAETGPPQPERRVDMQRNPLLIDAEMISAVQPSAAAYLEVVYSDEGLGDGCAGMVFAQMEAGAASELPNPRLHVEVSNAMIPILNAVLRRT